MHKQSGSNIALNIFFVSYKYFGFNINNRNCTHDEIRLRLKAENGRYFATSHLFNSKLLSIRAKENPYYTYLRPAVSCSTWATTVGDKKKFNIFEGKVLGKCMDSYIILRGEFGMKDKQTAETIVQERRCSWIYERRMIGVDKPRLESRK